MHANALKFLIDGRWLEPIGTGRHTLINPATEEPVCEIAMGGAKDVDRAVAAAKAAFPSYSMTTPAERRRLLQRLLELYNENYDEIAAMMTEEMGTTARFSHAAQAWVGRAHLETIIAVLETYPFEELRGDVLISREAVGVCGLITPWNWPMNQLVVKVVPALAAGCTMVVKPSEYSPLSSIRFSELVNEAGFPPGVYNYINGEGHVVGEAMSRHPDIDMMSITGSTRAGVAVAKASADTIKRVHQELGGKSANIILADADFEEAIVRGVHGCYTNCGQACKAPTRMLVPHERMDEAARIAARTANAIRVGSPTDPASEQGPVVNRQQYERIQALIESGIAEGARLVAGGPGRPQGLNRGYYVRPTVFAHVMPDMTIAREEIFGPVLSILGYSDESDAVRIANDTIYGLAGYIQTKDNAAARRIARQLRVGMVYINEADWEAASPFGGFKQSGNGREHGEFGLADFLEIKATGGYRALDKAS
ncbi:MULTISPECIES: aldehyde dehydrogenase family protein [Shinella]|uniref:Aldehyde dehydrogenase family protein n=1 Tax=Shinella sedimenti TaxID=2919913 RepID=A0ABT0CUB6_9HYPH|nr:MULTISPECIES: aldehyde dehydrogenase family protein [Shinella]MCJ8151944.1 aldehyde dehydrogenase family protein [Shinella sedimenti]